MNRRNETTMWLMLGVGGGVLLLGDWAPRWIEWGATFAIWWIVWAGIGSWMRARFATPQRRHNDRGNR